MGKQTTQCGAWMAVVFVGLSCGVIGFVCGVESALKTFDGAEDYDCQKRGEAAVDEPQ